MSSFQIIVGSMLGTSEYVAQACQETLMALGHDVNIHFQPKLTDILSEDQIWLICTSTHGAGDYPENIQPFIDDLIDCEQNLSSTKLITIGLGDSSYDTFCYAAKNINNLLLSKGCIQLLPLKKIDMSTDIDPEEDAQQWLLQLKTVLY